VKFCGEIIGSGQRRIDSEKLEVIEKIQAPTNKTELRQVLGLLSFFRDYILRYADLAQPLTDLIKKGVPDKLPWSEVRQQAVDKLKQLLIEAAKSTCGVAFPMEWMCVATYLLNAESINACRCGVSK